MTTLTGENVTDRAQAWLRERGDEVTPVDSGCSSSAPSMSLHPLYGMEPGESVESDNGDWLIVMVDERTIEIRPLAEAPSLTEEREQRKLDRASSPTVDRRRLVAALATAWHNGDRLTAECERLAHERDVARRRASFWRATCAWGKADPPPAFIISAAEHEGWTDLYPTATEQPAVADDEKRLPSPTDLLGRRVIRRYPPFQCGRIKYANVVHATVTGEAFEVAGVEVYVDLDRGPQVRDIFTSPSEGARFRLDNEPGEETEQ
jgi:hypothetical protein